MFEEFGHIFFPEAPPGVSAESRTSAQGEAEEEEEEEAAEEADCNSGAWSVVAARLGRGPGRQHLVHSWSVLTPFWPVWENDVIHVTS